MTGIRYNYNNHTEIANLLADGLISSCRSLRGIRIKFRVAVEKLLVVCFEYSLDRYYKCIVL